MLVYDQEYVETPNNNSLGKMKKLSEKWWQTEARKREEYNRLLTPTRNRKKTDGESDIDDSQATDWSSSDEDENIDDNDG
ncbi:hypothetical protein TNCV_3702161 [Trichonephila clavipes]|nr:hypothetical protein TNCV_3702161 [Trichonephila clavipes]